MTMRHFDPMMMVPCRMHAINASISQIKSATGASGAGYLETSFYRNLQALRLCREPSAKTGEVHDPWPPAN
ncbi:hypothetical protein [Methylocystis sp. WRRC1]|uniref:hypothetical protein n=1 Tax=Methylocystis sp. WRRC1 TaxID=1732014 RepID=UPI001D15A313|nr:hypothetical protein [Methylocystis sp. WRRC1]